MGQKISLFYPAQTENCSSVSIVEDRRLLSLDNCPHPRSSKIAKRKGLFSLSWPRYDGPRQNIRIYSDTRTSYLKILFSDVDFCPSHT